MTLNIILKTVILTILNTVLIIPLEIHKHYLIIKNASVYNNK